MADGIRSYYLYNPRLSCLSLHTAPCSQLSEGAVTVSGSTEHLQPVLDAIERMEPGAEFVAVLDTASLDEALALARVLAGRIAGRLGKSVVAIDR